MRVALCGLPFCGKSTVFRAIVGQQVQPKSSASGKIQLNIGTLELKDKRLQELARLLDSEKVIYSRISLVDLVYLGASPAKGLQVNHLREFDALAVVIAVFSSKDPLKDLADIEAEFVLADLELLQNRVGRIKKEKKAAPKGEEDAELILCRRLIEALEEGAAAVRALKLGGQELRMLAGFQLLTLKPLIIIGNVSEEQLGQTGKFKFFSLCAKLEAEIAELPEKDRPGFLQEMGLTGLSRDKFIEKIFQTGEQIFFFTVVAKQARAWPVRRGTTALEAAGCVHSDMEKGFIRAEVINYKDFIGLGSFTRAKEKGLLRLESKEYIVCDGDIINFKFSV